MATIALSKHSSNGPRRRKAATSSSWPLWAKITALAMAMYMVLFINFLVTVEIPSEHNHGAHSEVTRPHASEAHRVHPKEAKVVKPGNVNAQQKSLKEKDVWISSGFKFEKTKAEAALSKYGASAIRKIMTAHVEPPMNDTVPGTGSQGDPNNEKDKGSPPEFVVPLPLRTNTPDDLRQFRYPNLQTCHDVPGKIPVDRGLQMDKDGNPIVWNVGDTATADDFPMQEAPYCPVDADPFLPWLHDVFPSVDGSNIVFIAQNKRLCKTGRKFRKDLKRLEPQVALMQPISVQRINEDEARAIAPELWHPDDKNDKTPRYRLAPFEESADDGQSTRFICRFHATDFSQGDRPRTVILGETLSTFPFNYEFVSYRKQTDAAMLTPRGKDTKMFWTSNLQFTCPVPDTNSLRKMISTGETILSDATPTVYVDLVPIRTPPRYGRQEFYFPEGMIKPDATSTFDAKERWGVHNVMPRVEASGRWTNIPICFPPSTGSNRQAAITQDHEKETARKSAGKKPHTLSACLWAASSFRTRGSGQPPVSDTMRRLEEWIEFHLMVGFDHIYVYDNSAAQTNETTLAPVLDTYPPSKVTRIDWPSTACNNNIPAHDNTGERSSQYAAENSCRTRYAPFTEWIASFDTDEYLLPLGNYTDLKDVLNDAKKGGTNVLSFRSSRAKLRFDSSRMQGSGRVMIDNATFLDAYNCDSAPVPKPSWADRARKQIYRADFVKYHFVHYSTVTEGILQTFAENPDKWQRQFGERSPSERVTDEENEAIMLHTKTTSAKQTANWINRCHFEFEKKWRGCYVGFPWPNGTVAVGDGSHRDDGMEYNCWENDKITSYWGPRLREALAKRHEERSV